MPTFYVKTTGGATYQNVHSFSTTVTNPGIASVVAANGGSYRTTVNSSQVVGGVTQITFQFDGYDNPPVDPNSDDPPALITPTAYLISFSGTPTPDPINATVLPHP